VRSIALLVTLLVAGLAHATPAEDLARARASFRRGDYATTIAILTPLLYPTKALSAPGQLTEAHVMLGVAYFEMGRRESAGKELEEALFIDENVELDPLLYSAEVIELFNARRAALKGRLAAAAEQRRLAEENEAFRKALESSRQIVVEHRAYYVNFIPFGAGQFQNGNRGKGTFFFLAEALLAGTSMALYSAQVLEWGFPLRVPADEADSAKTLQVIQVGTGGLFLLVAAWGIIDALSGYQPTVTVTREIDPDLIPPEMRPRFSGEGSPGLRE